MSEFSERIVKQTEALLHFQHDETLQETTPERLHEALGQVIMMEISDNGRRPSAVKRRAAARSISPRNISSAVWSTATSSTSAFCAG